VLDRSLVMNLGVLGGLEEGRIENLLLDLRMHSQCLADVARQLLLFRVGAGLLELFEPLLDLAMVRLEQRDRIRLRTACGLARGAVAARGAARGLAAGRFPACGPGHVTCPC